MNLDKHIWEGWTARDFIEQLEIQFNYEKDSLKTKEEVRKWCADNQPYYKKRIPEVSNYFIKKLGL